MLQSLQGRTSTRPREALMGPLLKLVIIVIILALAAFLVLWIAGILSG